MLLKFNRKRTSAFAALGTVNSITATCSKNTFTYIEEKIKSRVLEIDDLMSVYKKESDISKINRSAGKKEIAVSDDTFDVIETAMRVSSDSDGAFDIRVRPLTQIFDIFKGPGAVPSEKVIENAVINTNCGNIVLNPQKRTVFLTHKSMALDLGGIAKGYACDEAAFILEKAEIDRAILNFGGNVKTIEKQGSKPFSVGIQNPLSTRGEYLGTLEISNASVVTSAVNEQFIVKNGKVLHHIIDPKTGKPANSGLLSVTVVGENSCICDALSTACFVLGIEKAVPLLEKYSYQGVFATEKKEIFCTNSLQHNFKQS